MRKQEAVDHYGSQAKVAQAIGRSRQAVSLWGEIIPEASAARLHLITNGKLVYDPELYKHSRTSNDY